jgi:hypothetical protein
LLVALADFFGEVLKQSCLPTMRPFASAPLRPIYQYPASSTQDAGTRLPPPHAALSVVVSPVAQLCDKVKMLSVM